MDSSEGWGSGVGLPPSTSLFGANISNDTLQVQTPRA